MNNLLILKNHKKIPPIRTGLVVMGDVHLFNSYPFSVYNEQKISSRLLDIKRVFIKAVVCAANLKLPLFINGDLITGRRLGYPVLKVLIELRDFIEKKKVRTIINLGNHDLDGNTTMLEPLFVNSSFIKIVFELEIIKLEHGLVLVCVPWLPSVGLQKPLLKAAKKAAKGAKFTALGLHVGFKEALLTGSRSETGLPQYLFTKKGIIGKYFDIIVASHYHRFQKIANGHGFYTGSLLPIDFGEREKEHGYHVLDFDKTKHYFICSKVPLFKVISLNKVKTFKKAQGNFIKVRVKDSSFSMADKERIRSLLLKQGAKGVVFEKLGSTSAVKSKLSSSGSSTVKELVVKFASLRAKEKDLDLAALQTIGLNILDKAKEKQTLSVRLSD